MWLTISSGDESGTMVEATGERFVIGRDDHCDLVLDDEKVSREHAFLRVLPDGGAEVHDLESSNGTFVDGRRITSPVVLRGGEHLRLGDTVLACSLAKPGVKPATRLEMPQPSAVPVTRAATPQPAAPQPAAEQRPVGRSTIQRLVKDALASEERSIRRSVLIASILGGLGLIAAAAVGALFATGTIGGSSGGRSASVTSLERATVLISELDANGNTAFFGSGSIIRRDGIILTNAHVATPTAPGLDVQYGIGTTSDQFVPAALRVSLFVGEDKPAKPLYLAKVLAYDGYVDAAVLRIATTLDGKPVSRLNLPTVPIGNSDRLRDGEQVTVVGYPSVGGGFEGAINVSKGTVSGFQVDSHIPLPRGWIKTDAAIAHGNSGGLAADPSGRLIGIPSRVQCGGSLFNLCIPGEDVQGKIRPVALALPVIRAAEAGRSWTSPYIVLATGNEHFTFSHWAAQVPDSSCNYTAVSSYPSGASAYTAVFDASGMAPGEDLAFFSTYARDEAATPQPHEELHVWEKSLGTGNSCYWASTRARNGDGIYSLQIFAGPNLQAASGRQVVKIG